MKHLLVTIGCFFCLAMSAQTGFVEFPYNPDSDGDDLIGTADLLDLLALYGLEFSEEDLYLNNDSTTAIYYAGNMPYFPCLENCSTLPGKWKLPNIFEIGRVWSGVASTSWLESPLEALTYSGYTGGFHPYYIETDGDINDSQASEQRGCYCYTHERPKVEYSYCEGTNIQECADSKMLDGWYPLCGISSSVENGTQLSTQAFWRWAE